MANGFGTNCWGALVHKLRATEAVAESTKAWGGELPLTRFGVGRQVGEWWLACMAIAPGLEPVIWSSRPCMSNLRRRYDDRGPENHGQGDSVEGCTRGAAIMYHRGRMAFGSTGPLRGPCSSLAC